MKDCNGCEYIREFPYMEIENEMLYSWYCEKGYEPKSCELEESSSTCGTDEIELSKGEINKIIEILEYQDYLGSNEMNILNKLKKLIEK